MNPGLISHFAKKGLLDAAKHFLEEEFSDINKNEVEKYLTTRNYPKLAQALGLHTIHCSESDNQIISDDEYPTDSKEVLYNTWSCKGLLNEGLIPIQIARGSHEDIQNKELPRVYDNKLIMSWAPAIHYSANSWVPFQNIEGVLIPHGEAFSLRRFFYDPETLYAPSQYYVYNYNPIAREYIENLPRDASLDNTNPKMEVIHPMNYNIKGHDIVGAMLIFKNNRGFWSGSIMDEEDAKQLFDHKFGPTVLQVSGGVFSSYMWMIQHKNAGNKWPEDIDTDFILDVARPYLGRVFSSYVDLTKTHIKDCEKFEDFLVKKFTK
jgi:homospermidine synthase